MPCACQNKWYVLNANDKIVHKAATEEAAKAVAARNNGTVEHADTYNARQRAARPANTKTPRTIFEVVDRNGNVLAKTATIGTARVTRDRNRALGATIRTTPPAAQPTS